MRTYKATYYDKRGTENIIVKSDGSYLYFTLRGIDFEGNDFEMLTGKEVDATQFDYELFADGSGDLTNFRMEIEMPILLFDKSEKETFTAPLFCTIEVGETVDIKGLDSVLNSMILRTSFGEFNIDKKNEWFEDSLIAIQNQLPENIYLKTCLSCKFSNYHPVGNGMFGSIYCFKNFKEEIKQFNDKHDLMDVWTEEVVKANQLFSVQETSDCPEHELPTKEDWYYKNWHKFID